MNTFLTSTWQFLNEQCNLFQPLWSGAEWGWLYFFGSLYILGQFFLNNIKMCPFSCYYLFIYELQQLALKLSIFILLHDYLLAPTISIKSVHGLCVSHHITTLSTSILAQTIGIKKCPWTWHFPSPCHTFHFQAWW